MLPCEGCPSTSKIAEVRRRATRSGSIESHESHECESRDGKTHKMRELRQNTSKAAKTQKERREALPRVAKLLNNSEKICETEQPNQRKDSREVQEATKMQKGPLDGKGPIGMLRTHREGAGNAQKKHQLHRGDCELQLQAATASKVS